MSTEEKLEHLLQALVKVADALESLGFLGSDLKRLVGESASKPQQTSIGENVFPTLKWEPSKGHYLGDFEVAFKAKNTPDSWQHAYNILRANNATIKNRFEGEGYVHCYWIYPDKYVDRIFRKKREAKT